MTLLHSRAGVIHTFLRVSWQTTFEDLQCPMWQMKIGFELGNREQRERHTDGVVGDNHDNEHSHNNFISQNQRDCAIYYSSFNPKAMKYTRCWHI